MGKVPEVTDASFEEQVLKSKQPVLVDFWAEWCGPCKQLAPVIEQLAAEHGSRLRVLKLNVDTSPATSARFSVRSIPTLLFFKNGQVVDSLVGAVPKKQIEAKLDSVLA